MHARVYLPAKQATSSGRAKTHGWIVEPEPLARRDPDGLMGWIGSDDTEQQVILRFPSKEAAIAHCERKGWSFTVSEPHERIVKPKSYAENFIRKG